MKSGSSLGNCRWTEPEIELRVYQRNIFLCNIFGHALALTEIPSLNFNTDNKLHFFYQTLCTRIRQTLNVLEEIRAHVHVLI